MTTLIVGATRLAGELAMALEHGDPDYLRLRRRGFAFELDGVSIQTTQDALELALRHHSVKSVIDASEPFDERVSAPLAAACRRTRVPLLRALPDSFERSPEASRWRWVETFGQAGAAAIACQGTVVVALEPLTHLVDLGDLDGVSVVVHRQRGSADPPLPGWARVPLRTPQHRDDVSWLRELGAALLLTADTGDAATRRLLEAALRSSTDVVIVRRPAASRELPGGRGTVVAGGGVARALAWRSSLR